MNPHPSYRFFIETAERPVGPDHPAWSSQLPLRRHPASDREACAPTYGDYFQGMRGWLEGDGRAAMRRAAAASGLPGDPAEIRIFLAKHGEFYHPARLEASAGGIRGEWVVNVALSAPARELLVRETSILQRLARKTLPPFLPVVYGCGKAEHRPGVHMGLMLAEWFAGFHEFHLTRLPDGSRGVVLWDPAGNRLLAEPQIAAVYRRAACILTSYLDPDTFEAIGAWHHAAGDFVVRDDSGTVDLRLVTAREFRPLFGGAPEDLPGLLNAWLVFLLHLSLRTRLDRLDGTGDMAWSGPAAVGATVEGVLAGIAEKPFPEDLPLAFPVLFRRYLSNCPAEAIEGLCADIVARSFAAGSEERALAQAGLPEHVRLLSAAFARL